jgi:hypothetical protein
MMFASALLLAVNVAVAHPDSTYSSDALRILVARASESNRRIPAALGGYSALVESEVSLLLNKPNGTDGAVAGTAAASAESAAQIEQFEIRALWDRSGRYDQDVVGYRIRQLVPMISVLSMLRRPWTAPTLYGNRLSFIFSGPPELRSGDTTRAQLLAVHPFAFDRDEYYRFTGGDTVAQMKIGERTLNIVRVHVEPVESDQHAVVFSGDVLLDQATAEIIRMRGSIRLESAAGEHAPARLLRALAQLRDVAYIDFENGEREGRFWLPLKQRLEYQVMTGLTEARVAIRIQSNWRDVNVSTRTDTTIAVEPDTASGLQYTLKFAPKDSITDWSNWRSDLGAMTAETSARDFDDVAPVSMRPGGAPQWRWQARSFSDFLRYDRVEGLYTGLAGLLDFRDALPGVSVRGLLGYAWYENAVKGGVEAAMVRGPWVTSLLAERQLASTNAFQSNVSGAGNFIGGLFSSEDYDWVDRRLSALGVTREIGTSHSSAVRIEVGYGTDDGFSKTLAHGPIAGVFRPNQPVDPGSYVRTGAALEVGRNVLNSPISSGLGYTLAYERGDGTLRWQRTELQSLAQKMAGRFVFATRVDAAYVAGSNIPTQQVIEIGGVEGLPGYGYKAFAGNEAVIARSTVVWLLPFFSAPIHIGSIVLPGVAPQPQIGLFTGITAATADVQPLLNRLGWVTTNGWRSTLDLRLRFFGGTFSVGAARAVDHNGGWQLVIGVGPSL